jgi:hypothetical protein
MPTNIIKTHQEILDKKRAEIVAKLADLMGDYVLGGGTALALQIAHRSSYDFDFFSKKPIDLKILDKIIHRFKSVEVSVDSEEELTVFVEGDVKLSIIHYPFDVYGSIVDSDLSLKIFPIRTLTAMKAYTIGRRGTFRDYFDLCSIIKNEAKSETEELEKLNMIMRMASDVYKSAFSKTLFLEQLVYFEDIDNFEIIGTDGKSIQNAKEKVLEFFRRLVDNYTSTFQL